jgi:hypothetical protein
MVSYPNRLYRGWCSNEGNKRSHILHYRICTVRDITDYNGGTIPEEVNSLEEYFNIDDFGIDEPYYIVYGSFKFDFVRSSIKIFETSDLKIAVDIVEQLTGNKVQEDEVHNRSK